MGSVEWQTRTRSQQADDLAPDGSQIFWLTQVGGASMVACRLPGGQVSRATRHRTVEEVWYCVGGRGELWRGADDGTSEIVALEAGVSISIPRGTAFQFRAATDLELIIATTPPWPGADEAIPSDGVWSPA